MQRLFRIERAKLSARSLRFASELSILRSNLTLLDSSLSSIFAVPDLGEEFFDYNTQLEGGISPVATGFAEDKVTYLKDLINNLAHEGKISSQCAEDACYFLDYGQHYVKVGGNVVLIPYETIEEQAQIAKRLENASAPSHKSRWWLWLLPVIAALGLFALWYFVSNQDKSQDPKTLGDKQEQALEQGTTSSKPNQEGSEDPENLNVKADELPGKGADLTATLDKELGSYRVSIRSRGPIINEVAANHGGGGHKFASGTRLKTEEEILSLIHDLDIVTKEYIEKASN